MTDRTMLIVHADEHTVLFRTVSARAKSPRRFCATYDELDRLRRDGHIISNDIHCFLQARLDGRRDLATFDFTWLTGHCFDRVEGFEQTIRIRWSQFQSFLEECRQPDGPRDFRTLSQDAPRCRPRLVFDGDKTNLRAAIGNPQIRHKLGKALTANFQRSSADEVRLYNDFAPYSFFFREFWDGNPCLCGGLILHGQEDMPKAYYGIHT